MAETISAKIVAEVDFSKFEKRFTSRFKSIVNSTLDTYTAFFEIFHRETSKIYDSLVSKFTSLVSKFEKLSSERLKLVVPEKFFKELSEEIIEKAGRPGAEVMAAFPKETIAEINFIGKIYNVVKAIEQYLGSTIAKTKHINKKFEEQQVFIESQFNKVMGLVKLMERIKNAMTKVVSQLNTAFEKKGVAVDITKEIESKKEKVERVEKEKQEVLIGRIIEIKNQITKTREFLEAPYPPLRKEMKIIEEKRMEDIAEILVNNPKFRELFEKMEEMKIIGVGQAENLSQLIDTLRQTPQDWRDVAAQAFEEIRTGIGTTFGRIRSRK